MNVMLYLKLFFVTAIFFVLVLLGLNNRTPVDFNLSPILTEVVKQPAALMYFGFFAVGLITGAVLNMGSGSSRKPADKSGKPA